MEDHAMTVYLAQIHQFLLMENVLLNAHLEHIYMKIDANHAIQIVEHVTDLLLMNAYHAHLDK